jgi:hypothetical protein
MPFLSRGAAMARKRFSPQRGVDFVSKSGAESALGLITRTSDRPNSLAGICSDAWQR